jgi:hypothetical protein
MVKHEYECPRCNHRTSHKNDMKKHFSRKRMCANENGINLTDEIMAVVLEEYKYHPPPKEPSDSKNITINNTINKYVLKMDFGEKMKHILEYQQKKLLCFEDNLESQFENRVNRLEMNSYPNGYFLDQNDFFKIINNATKVSKENIEEFGIFYRRTIKRLELYSGTSWESFIEEDGVLEVVRLIKSYFLDHYEQYIIRHLYQDGAKTLDRSKLVEHLRIYYRFISIFDLRPHISDLSDCDLLGHRLGEDNEYVLAEKCMGIYSEEKSKLKINEKNQTKRKVINIIKENTIQNSSELDNLVLEILQADDIFRQKLLKAP